MTKSHVPCFPAYIQKRSTTSTVPYESWRAKLRGELRLDEFRASQLEFVDFEPYLHRQELEVHERRLEEGQLFDFTGASSYLEGEIGAWAGRWCQQMLQGFRRWSIWPARSGKRSMIPCRTLHGCRRLHHNFRNFSQLLINAHLHGLVGWPFLVRLQVPAPIFQSFEPMLNPLTPDFCIRYMLNRYEIKLRLVSSYCHFRDDWDLVAIMVSVQQVCSKATETKEKAQGENRNLVYRRE